MAARTRFFYILEVVVDVIIEGKITSEEGMDDVLRTCAEIKSVKTPILRINDNTSDLQGRIAFSQGGYIIGAKINPTGEVGYPAIRRLLMISDGNYAILDPLRKHITEVNQSLWIKVDKVVPLLPNLPEDPEGLVDKAPEVVPGSLKSGQVDVLAKMQLPEERAPEPAAMPKVDAKSKSRKFNIGAWRFIRAGLVVVVGFGALLAGFMHSDEVVAFFQSLMGQK